MTNALLRVALISHVVAEPAPLPLGHAAVFGRLIARMRELAVVTRRACDDEVECFFMDQARAGAWCLPLCIGLFGVGDIECSIWLAGTEIRAVQCDRGKHGMGAGL